MQVIIDAVAVDVGIGAELLVALHNNGSCRVAVVKEERAIVRTLHRTHLFETRTEARTSHVLLTTGHTDGLLDAFRP
jgi:hypothetical protein